MGHIYFDESIHPRGGFAVGAFVYSPASVDGPVRDVLQQHGLAPGKDEFKSSARMDGNSRLASVRSGLLTVLHKYAKIAVLVAPASDRKNLGIEALQALGRMLVSNRLESERHEVFLDEGLVPGVGTAKAEAERLDLGNCTFHFEQDSKQIGGLQVADLAAHTCSIMLLEHTGHVNKMVKVGPGSGYDPDMEVDIGWDLWTGLRYAFFNAGPISDTIEWPDVWMLQVDGYGLFLSSNCDDRLRLAARERFGRCYVGCIH